MCEEMLMFTTSENMQSGQLQLTKSEQNMRDGEENRPGFIENSRSLSFRDRN